MKKILLGAAATVLVAGSAIAADMPLKAPLAPPPVWDWTGPYAGVNAGVHWGEDRITYAADPRGWGSDGAAEIDRLSAVTLKARGPMGGLQLGYNWQTTNIVWGIEVDANEESGHQVRQLSYANALIINPADVATDSISNKWLETVRARLGVTGWGPTDDPNRYLVYVTGGLAAGTVQVNDTFCSQGCPPVSAVVPDSGSDTGGVILNHTRAGWTAGGGIEDRLGSLGHLNVSAKLEYLFVDLGSFNTLIPSCVNCAPFSDIAVRHKLTDNIVRLGLNVLWGAPAFTH